jgi:crotonobetainyl-CoA:carnitine CoA-transferase CaiB-like acyl-CoA transferase
VEAAVAERTCGREDEEVAAELRSRGVPAAAVLDGVRLLKDEHLEARGFWADLEHDGIGTVRLPGPMWHFARDALSTRYRAPLLGEHTEDVLRRVGKLSEAEVASLAATGATSRAVPMEQ